MTDWRWLDDLELSTRAHNACKNYGVTSLEAFMALTRDRMRTWSGIGRRTWQEIEDMQTYLDPSRGRVDLMQAVRILNQALEDRPTGLVLRFDEHGFLEVYKRVNLGDG